MSIHHGTIRKYTAALLDLFNGIEVQYSNSHGNVITKSIPVKYSSREKSKVFDEYTTKHLRDGNYNVLPRANLALSTMVKADARVQNKNMKINTVVSDNFLEYQYNSIPYEFTFELAFQCRGMNEATQIVEQVATKFNPTVNIDIWDGSNLDEPTRVPVKLLDIALETEEYEELSSNIVTVNVGLSLKGNLYPPIKQIERVKKFKMYLNEKVGDNYFERNAILGWDVNTDGILENEQVVHINDVDGIPPHIVDIVCLNAGLGDNDIEVIYTDADEIDGELPTITWEVTEGFGTITSPNPNSTTAILNVQTNDDIEVTVKIVDITGAYAIYSKTFIIGTQDLLTPNVAQDLNTATESVDLNNANFVTDLNE